MTVRKYIFTGGEVMFRLQYAQLSFCTESKVVRRHC